MEEITMYKKIIKAAMGSLLSLSLAVAGFGMTANAKGKPTTPSNPLNASGRISIDSKSATATTTFSRPGTIKATAIVYYWSGKFRYSSQATNSNNIGGTSATAEKKVGGADVEGGMGKHHVTYGATRWDDTTNVGTIYDDAIPQ